MNNRAIVLYATREGQTRKIAEHVASELRARGLEVDARNVADAAADVDLGDYATAVLAASLHAGRHEREMVKFAREHRKDLERMPAAFLSVSLSEAGAEDPSRTPEARARFAKDVAASIREFLYSTGWRPARVVPVAGALVYTHYNPLVRFVMKRIAKKVGASTDTSRDYEYTDWLALDRFASELADEIGGPRAAPLRAPA